VCGQIHVDIDTSIDDAAVERDLQTRIAELDNLIEEQDKQLGYTTRNLKELSVKKRMLDEAISKATTDYDSSYLSAVLNLERKHMSHLPRGI
jgi:hypothetical protein